MDTTINPQIELSVKSAIEEIFRKQGSFESIFWGRRIQSQLAGHLLLLIRNAVREEGDNAMKQTLRRMTGNERFIDDIVKRIKDKQLPRG